MFNYRKALGASRLEVNHWVFAAASEARLRLWLERLQGLIEHGGHLTWQCLCYCETRTPRCERLYVHVTKDANTLRFAVTYGSRKGCAFGSVTRRDAAPIDVTLVDIAETPWAANATQAKP